MTSPALRRIKEGAEQPPAGIQARWMSLIAVGTLTGGLVLSLAALLFQKNDLAIGLSLGAILSVLNFQGLKALTDKVVQQAHKGRNVFWFWNLFRWVLFAVVCASLAALSPVCLLGAVVSYLLSLLSLGWTGYRMAAKSSRDPGKPL